MNEYIICDIHTCTMEHYLMIKKKDGNPEI